MSTPLRTSYPVPVEDLIPDARRLAAELGEIPSQNRLMKHLRVGKDKAKAVHAALTEERTEDRPETRLHSVPDPDETMTETEVTETAPEAAARGVCAGHADLQTWFRPPTPRRSSRFPRLP